ncbi:MAG: hypothetical protein ACE14P_02640 [Methanotrichaceae archaeon]
MKMGMGTVYNPIQSIHWAIWAILIAATLNFVAALVTGSLVNLLACLGCLIGLAGVATKVDASKAH